MEFITFLSYISLLEFFSSNIYSQKFCQFISSDDWKRIIKYLLLCFAWNYINENWFYLRRCSPSWMLYSQCHRTDSTLAFSSQPLLPHRDLKCEFKKHRILNNFANYSLTSNTSLYQKHCSSRGTWELRIKSMKLVCNRNVLLLWRNIVLIWGI